MPTNKHKRKASSHANKKVQNLPSSGIITLHPKSSFWTGLFLIVVSMYLLAFESQNNAMFGLAMLALITGVAVTAFAKMSLNSKSKR
jgi:hypothetical protein